MDMGNEHGKQEYSSRTLGATWGIISAVMVPIVIVLICIGWRILLKRKQEEKEEEEFMNIKTRPMDPEESYKTDDDSIPYKKDISDENEGVKVTDSPVDSGDINASYNYGQPYQQQQDLQTPPVDQQDQARKWVGETEIN